MNKNHSHFIVGLLSIVPLTFISSSFAAQPINLSHEKQMLFQSFASPEVKLAETKRSVDFNNTMHIRFTQTYNGYPVWGADGVLHVPQNGASQNANLTSLINQPSSTMNGIVYQGLQNDLQSSQGMQLNDQAAQTALNQAIYLYEEKTQGKSEIEHKQSQLIVYIDEAKKAHYAYWVHFDVPMTSKRAMPAQPNYVLDAQTLKVYRAWDNVQTLEDAQGGGYGGNQKTGKIAYDGLGNNLASFAITRQNSTCLMKNADVTVRNLKLIGMVANYPCNDVSKKHNNVYWNGAIDHINGGFSPSNDALFAGIIIKNLYQDWYNVPVLQKNGKAQMLTMLVHVPIENAFWNGYLMAFGDGGKTFYPLTSLGVGAHEVSHGFTQQHSNLVYEHQSGGLNEAFSDMAAQAAEVFAYGHNSWQIGPEIIRADGKALRYMDKPSKDCEGKKPGDECSIDNAKQYTDDINVHHSSGVFNRAFYLIGTAKGWDVRKAFNIMVKANMDYWTSDTSFEEAACGVVKATHDYKYKDVVVKKAFKSVGIDTSKC